MPDWLAALKNDLLEITTPVARQFWPGASADDAPYYNYRYQHVECVEREARKLLEAYGGDEDVILAAVWIHDRYQPQYEGHDDHGKQAASWAEENLVKTGFPAAKIAPVVYAVANHSNQWLTIPENAKEARILWDADKLTKLGVSAVVTLLLGCAAFPQIKVTSPWLRHALHSTLEKLRELPAHYYFPLSQELGRERYHTLLLLCKALDEETGQDGRMISP